MEFETRTPIEVEQQPAPPAPPAAPPLPRLEDARAVHARMVEGWSSVDVVPVATGLRGLDTVLRGGLRRGEMVALAGAAGTGKSSAAIQVAVETARAGALVLYATVEMPAEEVVARVVAREMYLRASDGGRDLPVGFGDVLDGAHQRNDEVMRRFISASDVLFAEVFPRLFVQQVPPGGTVDDLRGWVARARGQLGHDGLALVVVDPLQRLYAAPRGQRVGRVLDSVNSSETERVGAVAEDLKQLVDDKGSRCCAMFTSDTTKAAVMGEALGDGLELRGSYALAHWATVIGVFRAHENAQALVERTSKLGDSALDEGAIRGAADPALSRDDARALGGRYATVQIAKARRGPKRSFACAFVPGAGALVEVERPIEGKGRR